MPRCRTCHTWPSGGRARRRRARWPCASAARERSRRSCRWPSPWTACRPRFAPAPWPHSLEVRMSHDATAPVIVSACRTPIGRYLGGLAPLSAPRLGAIVVREAVRRAGIDSAAVEGGIMGNVLQGGVGQAPARQAGIHAGLPGTIPAMTVNKVCGAGLKAVMLAAQAIKAGDERCIVAGGMESMSNAPHYVYGMRSGIKAGDAQLVDGMIHDGLWGSFSNSHMGSLAEYTAEQAGV